MTGYYFYSFMYLFILFYFYYLFLLFIYLCQVSITTSYTMHGQTLEVVFCAKYLGVDISGDL